MDGTIVAARKIIHFSNLMDRIAVNWESGCWDWNGPKDPKGYGRCGFKGRGYLPHRLSKYLYGEMTWTELHTREVQILHECDNPACINPEHLSLGSNADNQMDKMKKGRQARGEKIYTAKLNAEDVRAIHRLFRTGFIGSKASVARKYGVDASTIGNILKGRTWKHIKEEFMQTRIYVVEDTTTKETRLIEATTPAQAVRYVAKNQFTARVATTKDVATAMSNGAEVETAYTMTSAPATDRTAEQDEDEAFKNEVNETAQTAH